MSKTRVALLKCENYKSKNLTEIVRKAMLSVFDPSFAKQNYGKKILIKPNILSGTDPSFATTTHPSVVEATIIILKEFGFEIYVGDSPAIDNLVHASKKAGIDSVMKKHKIPYADFSSTCVLKNPRGSQVKEFRVVKALSDVDFIVNLPKLKTHSQMYYTGAVKNLFGLIYNLQKSRFHFRFQDRTRFARMIVDLCVLAKPKLSIMDAVVSMQGEGPRNGIPYNSKFIAASCDPVALDYACSKIIGYDPEKIPIINDAMHRDDVFISSSDDVEYCFLNPDDLTCKDFERVTIMKDVAMFRKFFPDPVYNIIRKILIPRPYINHSKCKICKKCLNICSADAIYIAEQGQNNEGKTQKKVEIIDQNCIRCYCCHEVCPYDAMYLKRKIF